jgi:endonuclease YncB( thermonuclease family)
MKQPLVNDLRWQRLPRPVSVHHLTLHRCTVKDGDTIAGEHRPLFRHNETLTIRLAGINCPEKDERYGTEATAYTRKFCEGKTVSIEYAKDRHGSWMCEGSGYGRLIGFVWRGGRCLNTELVKRGLAHLYSSPDWMTKARGSALLRAQRKAEKKHRFIWKRNDTARSPRFTPILLFFSGLLCIILLFLIF